MSFKDGLKRILPPPVNSFNREIARVLEAIETDKTQQSQMERRLRDENAAMLKLLGTLQAEQDQRLNTLEECLQEQNRLLTSMQEAGIQNFAKIRDEIQTKCKDISENLERTRQQSIEARRHASEAVWAQIFNNTITNSTWLKDKTFSPGRWAVGYPYLYVMYRVLDEARPKHILELGLGQSTRMIAQYAAAFDDVEHIVVEQDAQWIKFFSQNYACPPSTTLMHIPVTEIQFIDDDKTLVYENFSSIFAGKTFDFISVDGPGHSRSDKYRRIDLLELIPDCIAESYCILFDDMNDPSCMRAYELIIKKMERMLSGFVTGNYNGFKHITIVTSQDKKFLASL